MANVKISELSNAASLSGNETLPIVQSETTVKTTAQVIANLYNANTGSLNTGSFTGSFVGNGSGLTNLPSQTLQTVTTAGNIAYNRISAYSPIQGDSDFIGLQVFDNDTNFFNIRPNSIYWDGEEGETIIDFYHTSTQTVVLSVPPLNGTFAVIQNSAGFVLPTTIPSNPQTGSIYFHSASATLRVWNGSWVSIS